MAYAGPDFSPRATPAVTNYARTSAALGDIRARLTTGERVLRIGDDVAAITTAVGLQAQGSTLRSALSNGAKTNSFLQIAYDGLDQIKSVLKNLSDMTASANEAGRTPRQLKTLDAQFQSGLTDIDAIVATTTYGGSSILDGSISGTGVAVIPAGNVATDTITIDIPDVSSATLFPVAASLGSTATASSATTKVGNAQQTLSDAIAKVDAYQLRLTTASAAVNDTLSGLSKSLNNLLSVDTSAESQREDYLLIQNDTAAALLAQSLRINSGLLSLLG